MNINTGDADIDSPSDALAKTFMPSRSSTKNPFKELSKTTPAKEPNTPFNLATFQPSFPPQYSPYMPSPFGYFGYSPSPQYQHLPLPLPPQPTAAPETNQVDFDLPPSSPQSQTDSCQKLVAYFNYLIRKNSSLAEPLGKCLEKLQEDQIVFETIEYVTDQDFDDWDIKKGIRLLLKSQKAAYLKAKKQGRA